MAEACIRRRWKGGDGRMLAQTLGCVRQFGVVASLMVLFGLMMQLPDRTHAIQIHTR